MGCEAAIRNLITHGARKPEEEDALEMLAALSVLAQWIDEAKVEKVSP
jgi:RNase H-fold protein (predicted Holliday junction resolvase)